MEYFIVSILLGIIGLGIDSLNSIETNKLKSLASKISKVLSKNSDEYTKFKAANAEAQSQIVQSIIYSSGLGPRFNSLRQELRRLKDEDKAKTNTYAEAQRKGQAKLDEVNTRADNTRSNIFATAGEAIGRYANQNDTIDSHQDAAADKFDVTQNINAGLQSSERNS